MARTKIPWATYAWNPVTGCEPISPGCTNCYAKRMASRLKGRCGYPQDEPFRPGTIHTDKMDKPSSWKKPKRVFVCSMGDLFHEAVAFETILEVYNAIPDHHRALVLTKRPARAHEFYQWVYDTTVEYDALEFPFDECWGHIWLGVTVCTQEEADEKIPILLGTPSHHRFVSIEPMLGPVDLRTWFDPFRKLDGVYRKLIKQDMFNLDQVDSLRAKPEIDWVIVGGESGAKARPIHPGWAASIRDQCQSASVPFFFKQWGEWAPRYDPDHPIPEYKTAADILKALNGFQAPPYCKKGNHAAGHLLDGKEYREFPEELLLPGEEPTHA